MSGKTRSVQMICGSERLMRASALVATLAVMTTGCATKGGSETERAICSELRRDLPTWSTYDTAESKGQGADFIETFDALCPEYPPVFGSFLGGVGHG